MKDLIQLTPSSVTTNPGMGLVVLYSAWFVFVFIKFSLNIPEQYNPILPVTGNEYLIEKAVTPI